MHRDGEDKNSLVYRRTAIHFVAGFLAINLGRLATNIAIDFDWLEKQYEEVVSTVLLAAICALYGFSLRRAADRTTSLVFFGAVVLLAFAKIAKFTAAPPSTVIAIRSILDASALMLLVYQFACLLRLAADAEKKREERLLQDLADATSHRVGEDFLSGLASAIARTLNIQVVFLSERLVDSELDTIVSLAGTTDVAIKPGLVAGQSIDCTDSVLRSRYPEMRVSVVDLLDASCSVIGHICLLQEPANQTSFLQSSSLRVFASRAAAELQRRSADRKHAALEAHMLQVQKLESIGLLAGGIAHDFNNLLCAIRNNATIARELIAASSPAVESLENIDTTVSKGATLCHRLLMYAGQGQRKDDAISLNQLVRDTVSIVEAARPECPVIGLQLTDAEPTLFGDEAQLSQIVLNLLLNAAEAITEKSGAVMVRTATGTGSDFSDKRMDLKADVGYAILEIQDNGAGIKESVLSQIFDPFFSTKDAPGRGFGLAAVAGIVRDHSGDLTVDTAVGEGTTFAVALPLVDSAPSHSSFTALANSVPPEPRKTPLVLVADDDDMVRSSLRMLLESADYRVQTAVCGEDALTIFEETGDVFCAVLLDYNMPGLSGVETYRRLRALGATPPISIVSGHIEAIQKEDLGDANVVQKPFTRKELLNAVQPISA